MGHSQEVSVTECGVAPIILMLSLFNLSGGHLDAPVYNTQVSGAVVLLVILTDATALVFEGLGGWLHYQDGEFAFLSLSDLGFRLVVFDGQDIQATANSSFAVSPVAPHMTVGTVRA